MEYDNDEDGLARPALEGAPLAGNNIEPLNPPRSHNGRNGSLNIRNHN
jgi:hypothetical protein